jgi:ribosome-binding protein aMBF1 (putative translation factor)
MIKNEREYKITKSFLCKYNAELADIAELRRKRAYDPAKLKVVQDAVKSKRDEYKELVDEYERLRRGKFDMGALDAVEAIPSNLIRARIALGWTQKELARRLGTSEQQIQKYEATDYESASFKKIAEIANVLRHG